MRLTWFFVSIVLTLAFVGCTGPVLTSDYYRQPPSDLERLTVDITLENAIYYSSDIFIGQVLEIAEDHCEFYSMFKVQVESVLASSYVEANSVELVEAGNQELVVGNRYLFFGDFSSHPALPYDHYRLVLPIIIKIADDGNLLRLIDPKEQTYIKPFTNDRYNQLEPLISYIEQYRGTVETARNEEFPLMPRAVEKVGSWEELYQMAENVLMVRITQYYPRTQHYARAYVETIEAYKTGARTIDTVTIPTVQEDKIHIMFLSEYGVPVTRQDSIYSEEHPQYQQLLEWLQQRAADK